MSISSRWNHVKSHFAEWQCDVHSRRELLNLSDWILRDIGVSRCDAKFDAVKPFWT